MLRFGETFRQQHALFGLRCVRSGLIKIIILPTHVVFWTRPMLIEVVGSMYLNDDEIHSTPHHAICFDKALRLCRYVEMIGLICTRGLIILFYYLVSMAEGNLHRVTHDPKNKVTI